MQWVAVLLLQAAAATGGSWLDVPFVRQQDNGCGSASVWMVMQYWEGPSSPDLAEIHQALFSKEADGVYASDMELYLRRHGFQTFALRADWDELTEQLTKGRPLIVALEPAAKSLSICRVVAASLASSSLFIVETALSRRVESTFADFKALTAASLEKKFRT